MQFKRNTFKINHEPKILSNSGIKIKEWSGVAAEDKFVLWTIIFWLIGIITSLGLILLFFGKIPPVVPFQFSRTWGVNQLSPRNYLFLLPAGLFAIGTFNLGLGMSSYTKNQVLTYLLCAATLIVEVFVVFATGNIIHLVT